MKKVIQFGTGAFLRGFVDWMLDEVNKRTDFKTSVTVVQSTARGLADAINSSPEYTLVSRGIENGDPVVKEYRISTLSHCVNTAVNYGELIELASDPDYAYIVSNTTEAGIKYDAGDRADSPAASFPGKLTQLLFARFKAGLDGFTVLPCELIENNGGELRSIVLRYAREWGLGDEFIAWVTDNNRFLNTLVDRIVTGYDESLGDPNPLANTCELYHIWVIEGDDVGIPFAKAGLNVVYTDDLEKYRTRKVRILNGAHTSLIPYALLEGEQTVLDAISNQKLRSHLEGCLSEVIPTLYGLYSEDELKAYVGEVLERFANPYVKHKCQAIALNSISKFKVRCLPSIKAYFETFGKAPEHLSVACEKLIEFYKDGTPCDDESIINYIKTHTKEQILSEGVVFGEDISKYIAG